MSAIIRHVGYNERNRKIRFVKWIALGTVFNFFVGFMVSCSSYTVEKPATAAAKPPDAIKQLSGVTVFKRDKCDDGYRL
jgi:hypothetical protein